jgi:hypothetical protein
MYVHLYTFIFPLTYFGEVAASHSHHHVWLVA